ncbi:MAG TPA: hypothetical protein VHC97_22945 [Thermoanaerobaculia bacterium]|jgi:hypothetical protein|nr:hypothetical protein [Thermoanaerobaculia bacterium]
MRRNCLWLVTLALLALPALAQDHSLPTCGAAAIGSSPFDSSAKGWETASSYQPLAPGQRLFYGLTGLGQDSPLEVRYLVKGKPYLTEVVDLANAQPPKNQPPKVRPDSGKAPQKSETAFDFESLLKEERMIELLALRPDLVRSLHQLAKERSAIKVEIRQGGRVFETLSFQDLKRRSSELVKSPAVPLAVQSAVSGPGDHGEERQPPLFAKTYLENCSDCSWEMPCDTECGYEPGKGGPVTCGEQGLPCGGSPPTCSSSTVVSESWTGWYYLRSYFANQYACLRSYTAGSAVHRLYVSEYRRDLVRRSYVCPSAPSCSGCYYQDQVIAYEIGYAGCWYETPPLCSNGATPCCSELCNVGPFTPCYSGC